MNYIILQLKPDEYKATSNYVTFLNRDRLIKLNAERKSTCHTQADNQPEPEKRGNPFLPFYLHRELCLS